MSSKCKAITVTSGKGGVGKTTHSIFLAYAANSLDKRALIVDVDLGLSNVDIVLGVQPRYNISDVLDGSVSIQEAITPTDFGFDVLSSGSGLEDLANLGLAGRIELIQMIRTLENQYDIIVYDTSAGIHGNATFFCTRSDLVMVVTTAEPHAMTDAYAMIKVLDQNGCPAPIHITVNCAISKKEGEKVFEKINNVTNQYLGRNILHHGSTLKEQAFQEGIRRRKLINPKTVNSVGFQSIIQPNINLIDSLQQESVTMPKSNVNTVPNLFSSEVL